MLRVRTVWVVALLPLLTACASVGQHECACSEQWPVEPAATAAPG